MYTKVIIKTIGNNFFQTYFVWGECVVYIYIYIYIILLNIINNDQAASISRRMCGVFRTRLNNLVIEILNT
jgi:hypothetical protein